MATELGYFTIPVADVDREAQFYGSIFDWSFAEDADARYAHVTNTAIPMGLVRGEPASLEHLSFRVATITAVIERVRAAGGWADDPVRSASGLSAACRDTGGTGFSIWEPAPGY